MFWDKFSSSTLQTGRNSQTTQIRYRRREGGVNALPDTETKSGLSPPSPKAPFNKREGDFPGAKAGMWVWSLVPEDTTGHSAAKPVCATTTESALY